MYDTRSVSLDGDDKSKVRTSLHYKTKYKIRGNEPHSSDKCFIGKLQASRTIVDVEVYDPVISIARYRVPEGSDARVLHPENSCQNRRLI